MNPINPFLLSALLAIALSSCAGPSTREPTNLSTVKAEVAAYADSGKYEADLVDITGPAKKWISHRAHSGNGKLAVVFDIDETTLSNLGHMTEADWGYQPDSWSKWVMTGKAPAIASVREVYQTAMVNKVAVFFITGRRESEKAATARNLRQQGMGDYQAIYVRSDASKTPVGPFKTAQRKHIAEQGYSIIANLGDQQSDLDGGYAERTFKLPNPFYLIP
ncbi:MAG: HAD family acid phosphatase [Luteolibacter sp.]